MHTGQYIYYRSQTPWKLKASWIKALYHRAQKIFSNKQSLNKQISQIKTFMSWHGYPNELLKRYFKKNANIVIKYRTNKLSIFCPTKNRISWTQKANVIYIIQCPGCDNDYVGKTDRNLVTRLSEHGKKEDQPMFQDFRSCEEFKYKLNLYSFADISSDIRTVDDMEHVYNSVIDNCKILESWTSWTILQYIEVYYIKTKSPLINVGLKASKELQLLKLLIVFQLFK